MCNAAINRPATVLLVILLALTAVSCGNDKEKYQAEATQMLQQANDAFEGGRFHEARALLDSLDSQYPKAVDTRRDALHLRTRVQEGLTLEEIRLADSLAVSAQVKGDSLSRLLQRVSNPLESYFVAPGQNVDVEGATGLFCRMMPDGTIYMVSALARNKVGHTSVTLSSGTLSATTKTVPHDGERNDRSTGTEIINYTGSECDTIARLVEASPDASYTLTFNGAGGAHYSMPLPEGQRRAIAIMGGIVRSVNDVKRYSARREALRQRLDVIRQQMSRTHRDDNTPTDND